MASNPTQDYPAFSRKILNFSHFTGLTSHFPLFSFILSDSCSCTKAGRFKPHTPTKERHYYYYGAKEACSA